MKTNHTPGPWVVVDGKNYATEIQAKSQRGKSWVIARTTAAKTGQDVAQANARLIVASPCMYEAIADYLNPLACRQKTHEKLMAAFAKATGEAR